MHIIVNNAFLIYMRLTISKKKKFEFKKKQLHTPTPLNKRSGGKMKTPVTIFVESFISEYMLLKT